MSNKVLLTVLFLVAVVGMAGYWFMYTYQPYLTRKAELESKIEKIKKEIQQAGNIKEELERKEKKLQELKAQLAQHKDLLSTSKKIPDILRKTEKAAKDCGVKFKDIHISPMVEYEGYSEIPIEIGLEGTYHKIGEFLAEMENLRMLNINNGTISISPKGRVVQQRIDNKLQPVQPLNVVLNVKAFILGPGGDFFE